MSCCCNNNQVSAVVINSTSVTKPTASPVVLTVDGVLPTGCCFTLCIAKGFLVNSTTAPVSVADSAVTYQLFDSCADLVRWDQLIEQAYDVCSCGSLKLRAKVRSTTDTARILIDCNLPNSSYAPTVAS